AAARLRCVLAETARIPVQDGTGTLRETLATTMALASHTVDVARNGNRTARKATVELRAGHVQLKLRDDTSSSQPLTLYVVWALEKAAPVGVQPLDWLLLTSHPVRDVGDALAVVDSYRARWRVEEFHRTWKTGHCNVEDAQLRSFDAIVKWSTILAAVA